MLEKVASNHAIGFEVAFRLGTLFEWGFDKAVSLCREQRIENASRQKGNCLPLSAAATASW